MSDLIDAIAVVPRFAGDVFALIALCFVPCALVAVIVLPKDKTRGSA